MLQQAQAKLLGAVAREAKQEEEAFFVGIAPELHALCVEVAKEVGADSAAVFFVTEDNPPGTRPAMVMRGASGQLRKTFAARVEVWRKWRAQERTGDAPAAEEPELSGFAYYSRLTPDFLALGPEERQREIQRWSVTNQIWHLAKGRIANSNRAMDELHGGHQRAGKGDHVAYPGDNLYTTFRTMVGVPIFALGGKPETVRLGKEEESPDEYPASASSRAEFLSKYRVIGILKVEGKRPPPGRVPDPDAVGESLRKNLTRKEIQALKLKPSDAEQKELAAWCRSVCDSSTSLEQVFGPSGEYPLLLRNEDAQGNKKSMDEKERALTLRKAVSDALTNCCHAEFTRNDLELLVLLAMQVGRLMSRRVIQCAADNDIILGENEVGLLNVRWQDVGQLAALDRAAEAAKRKVRFHLEALRAELDFTRRQDMYRVRVSELLDSRGPIRAVDARRKEFISLVRKLVRKQRRFQDEPDFCEVACSDFNLRLEGYDYRSGERCIARGDARVFLHRPDIGKGEADVMLKLGAENAPQMSVDRKNLSVALSRHICVPNLDLPLVQRILDPGIYGVDDLAGVRIITDYESDVEEVVDELRARVGEWNVELGKIENIHEGKQGSYRAVHATVYTDVEPLVPAEDARVLRKALDLPEERRLKVPVEIQLRTAYQHSWALKTHAISYKREEQIAQEWRDEQQILSNVLAEADWLSDIVRNGIESMLLPSDYGEHRLLDCLRRRIPRDDRTIVKFGIACAKEICKDLLRYTGQPEYSFAMEVCESLVYGFDVVDSTMLLLAMLRNVWRAERGKVDWDSGKGEQDQKGQDQEDEDIVALLCQALQRTCPAAVEHYRDRLSLSPEQRQDPDWLRLWLGQFPTWFWTMQRNFRAYFKPAAEDRTRQVKERLQNVYHELKRRHGEGQWRESLEEWLERAYLMEAAVLLANLTELPFEPSLARRQRLHRDYLALYREICRYLPNGPSKTRVVEVLERAFREVEAALDLSREPEWWDE